MKIAHIIFGLTGGGMETMLVNIANAQAQAAHDVEIIVVNNIYEPCLVDSIDRRIRHVNLGRRLKSRNPWPIIKLNAELMKFKPDVVHIHVISLQRYILPRFRKIACATLHSVVKDNDFNDLKKLENRLISISDHVADDLARRFKLKSTTIINGIGLEKFKVKNGCRTASDPLKIVCVARLDHLVKGQHILLEALSRANKLTDNAITVDFIGDGDSLETLEEMSSRLGVTGQVAFLGYKSQSFLHEHLRDYDLMVLPSLTEGFGLSAAEGMAARLEILVSSGTGSVDVVDNGRAGNIFKNGDIDDCARSIAAIANRGTDVETANKGRERAMRLYDVATTAKKYLDYYAKMSVNRE